MDEETTRLVTVLASAQAQTAGQGQAVLFAVQALLMHCRSEELLATLRALYQQHYATLAQAPWPQQMNQAFDATRELLESAATPIA